MITLAIQLVFQSKPKLTHQEVTNYLIEHLPEGEIVLASGPTKEGEVRLKLNQDKLTDEQRDFLHLDEIAQQYIDTFQVLPNKPQAPQQLTIDAGNLREQVYIAEEHIQRAIDALAPIHHDHVLRQVMIDLNTAMEAILEIREMIPEAQA